MEYTVEEVKLPTGEIITNIFRTDIDGKIWAIPANESNSDYQAYLASLEEQA